MLLHSRTNETGRSAIQLALCLVYISFAFGQSPGVQGNSDRSRQIAASTEPRYQRANDLRKAGKNDEALVAINEAIRFDSDCGKCFGLRSGIKGNLQKYADGVADGHIGILRSKTPHDKAMASYNKGFNLGGLGRNSEAEEAYNDSISFDPTYEMGFFGKGKTLYFLAMWAKSAESLEKALSLNPNHGAAWAYLAEDQLNLGDASAGIASAERAVQLAPTDARSYRARTIARFWQSDYAGMLADATRSLEIDSTRPHAHLLRGHALKLLGRLEESSREYSLEPDRAAVERGLSSARSVDLRIYNCGDFSTEVQTPSNYNIDGFTECKERVLRSLEEQAAPVIAPLPAKRPIPGLPAKKPAKK